MKQSKPHGGKFTHADVQKLMRTINYVVTHSDARPRIRVKDRNANIPRAGHDRLNLVNLDILSDSRLAFILERWNTPWRISTLRVDKRHYWAWYDYFYHYLFPSPPIHFKYIIVPDNFSTTNVWMRYLFFFNKNLIENLFFRKFLIFASNILIIWL